MKSTRSLLFSVATLSCLTMTASASLVLHWRLDEANGDYTAGGYTEQVHATTLGTEVVAGTDITEGLAGLAPGGGTSMSFSDTAADSYIAAGSVENTGGVGTHVSGTATIPLVLGNNFTMSAWFNTDVGTNTDRTILSNPFNSNTGFLFGIRGTSLIMDFGSSRHLTAAGAITVGQDYFMAVMQDPDGDTNHGWTAGANNRIALYNPTTATWQYFDNTQIKSGLLLQTMRIGAFVGGGREFDGLLDDVRVYNNTLTQADLNALALLGLSLALFRRRRRTGVA
jgi:hypothetical protein